MFEGFCARRERNEGLGRMPLGTAHENVNILTTSETMYEVVGCVACYNDIGKNANEVLSTSECREPAKAE